MLSNLGWLLVIVLGLVGLFVLICLPHNLRVRRVRRTYSSLPADVIEEVLRLIEQAAASGPSVTFLRLSKDDPTDEEVLLESHVGGVPYAEAGNEWPQETPEGEPAKFMLQVRLDEPSLGPSWQGRLIVAFLVFDVEQAVWSFANASIDKYVPVKRGTPPQPCIRLIQLRVPAAISDETVPISSDVLCKTVPKIEDVLRPYTKDFAGVVTQILRPELYGYDFDAPDIAYVGGDPMLIQNPHDPVCDKCGSPMRFLFLFGEIVPGIQMADAGVFYVYGCDDHPDQCKGFVDSH